MRILHVFDHSLPVQSGYTFRSREILVHQRRMGWDTVHVTSPKHPDPAQREETVDGLRFHRTPTPRGLAARLPVLRELAVVDALERRIERLLAEQGPPDILHAHSPALNGLAALRVARRHRIPLVYEVRAFWEDAAVDHGTATPWGPRYRATRALETHVLRGADAVTCICEGLRADIVARGIPAERVTVVPNAVDAVRFQPGLAERRAELAARHGLEGRRVLGFIGSFYAYEGLDLLLDALPRIVARVPQAHLLLVGGGPQAERLRERATRADVAPHVTLVGRVPHHEVSAYYDLVELFVYPRRSMRLTELVTPLKPLEAMAHGRLVAASAVGGHRELIRDGETGRLFAPDSPAALAEAVVDLLRMPAAQAEAMRRAGRRFVETERSWARCVARYREVYDRLRPGDGAPAQPPGTAAGAGG
ncbi:TIGR04063 family PEP-CTERM/XrtA system glycosyltransferase [Inmirania thermothiophila]|uniref:PEP-CTERM/exosortase A-associated glycosyltransferase n=1 Tax=Inmirania thermothiophila TaxID=1750597 RepID=A0A3N1YBI1_9GAMM|nr:TIGR04063 family PEP-CTERM/XrtA system glycosyltransferase [Inmirania thermothiophila]ROR34747.1 PEP-CTERM/exosortase A-associated glycosyltransferase [Inmirania thermothiophila]